MNFTIENEKKNNRGRNLQYRYQVTMFTPTDDSLDSEWVDTKVEAIEMAHRLLKRNNDVSYVMCYNNMNNKYSFKIERNNGE